jgi:hypothetical protein
LSFTYAGTTLALIPGPGNGVIEVSLDGDTPRRVELGGDSVWLAGSSDLFSPKSWHLERHKVELRAIEGEFGVDGFDVQRPYRLSDFWAVLYEPYIKGLIWFAGFSLLAWALLRSTLLKRRLRKQ